MKQAHLLLPLAVALLAAPATAHADETPEPAEKKKSEKKEEKKSGGCTVDPQAGVGGAALAVAALAGLVLFRRER